MYGIQLCTTCIYVQVQIIFITNPSLTEPNVISISEEFKLVLAMLYPMTLEKNMASGQLRRIYYLALLLNSHDPDWLDLAYIAVFFMLPSFYK